MGWKARGVGFEPTRPFDHRLSRPAPYQARATPQALLGWFCCFLGVCCLFGFGLLFWVVFLGLCVCFVAVLWVGWVLCSNVFRFLRVSVGWVVVLSRVLKAVLAIVVVVVVVFVGYAALTFPRTVVEIPVSLTIGVDAVSRQFDTPPLHDRFQVQVAVESGTSLWRARILNGSDVVWEHSAGQGEQTSYTSEWIALPSGSYNFTFATVGFGSLQAKVTVTSKGGFW